MCVCERKGGTGLLCKSISFSSSHQHDESIHPKHARTRFCLKFLSLILACAARKASGTQAQCQCALFTNFTRYSGVPPPAPAPAAAPRRFPDDDVAAPAACPSCQ